MVNDPWQLQNIFDVQSLPAECASLRAQLGQMQACRGGACR